MVCYFLVRRSRNAGYPASPAQIPACDIPAQGSSDILTLVAKLALTALPNLFIYQLDFTPQITGRQKWRLLCVEWRDSD